MKLSIREAYLLFKSAEIIVQFSKVLLCTISEAFAGDLSLSASLGDIFLFMSNYYLLFYSYYLYTVKFEVLVLGTGIPVGVYLDFI